MEQNRTFISHGPEDTKAFGVSLAATLKPGDFIALDGALGAGKTCLAQGLAEGLGYQGPVTSPTFTLLHIYEGGRLPLYHFDLYRLASPRELEGLGYEDYFYGDGVCVVEWAGLAPEYLPPRRICIHLESGTGDSPPFHCEQVERGTVPCSTFPCNKTCVRQVTIIEQVCEEAPG